LLGEYRPTLLRRAIMTATANKTKAFGVRVLIHRKAPFTLETRPTADYNPSHLERELIIRQRIGTHINLKDEE